MIDDEAWLQSEFIPIVQKRGGAVIEARGASSAGSAANAIVDSVVSLTAATPPGDWHSVALCSDGSYDVPAGLICSFPTRCDGHNVEIVTDVTLNDFADAKLRASVAELEEERRLVSALLPK